MPLFLLPILIPYYTDRQASMRIPFVTFGLILVCIGTLVLSYRAERAAERTFAAELDNAVQYAVRSPDVDDHRLRQFCSEIGDPECIDQVADDPMRKSAEQLAEIFAPFTGSPAVAEDPIPAAQQAEFDRRVERAREAYLAQPYARFGLVRGAINPLAIVTHQFLHAGLLHLLFNMLFLWLAMSSLENTWNRWFVLGFYLVCGALSGLLQLLFMGAVPLSPLIGASGGVAGLMGAYLVRYARSRIRTWYFVWILGYARTGTFFWPAWVALPLWLAWQVVQWLWQGSGEVAYPAHIGGFALGAAVALVVVKGGLEAKYLGRTDGEEEGEASPLQVQAESAAERGEWDTAVRLYRRLADASPYDDDLQGKLAAALAGQGKIEEADGIYRGTIHRLLETGRVAQAAKRYQEMGQVTGSVKLHADAMLTIAEWFGQQELDHYAVYTYERYLDFYPDDPKRLRALLGCVELYKHQREGREQAEELLAQAEELAQTSGTAADRGRIEVLRTALHQVPATPPLTATQAAGAGRVVGVRSEELAQNVDEWVSSPARSERKQPVPPRPRSAPAAQPEPTPDPPAEVGEVVDSRPEDLAAPLDSLHLAPDDVPASPRDDTATELEALRAQEAARSEDVGKALSSLSGEGAPPWPASLELPPDRSPWQGQASTDEAPTDDGEEQAGGESFEDVEDGPSPSSSFERAPTRKGQRDDGRPGPSDEGEGPGFEREPSEPPRAVALPSADASVQSADDEDVDAHPWTPPGARDPAASGEWGAVDSREIPPMEAEAIHAERDTENGEGVPEALRSRILQPRLSVLMALEPSRLSCETTGGAPFKLPLERVEWVAVGRIWYEDRSGGSESFVCDLIHGVHRTSDRVVVESVRMLSDRQPFGVLLRDAGMDEAENFRRLLEQLRPLLHEARFIPPKTGEAGGDVPTFAGLDDYERAMMFRIVGER